MFGSVIGPWNQLAGDNRFGSIWGMVRKVVLYELRRVSGSSGVFIQISEAARSLRKKGRSIDF